MNNKEWFAEWFDSPYYHILYKDRNHEEAAKFISKLMAYLSPETRVQILDLACGKGRHSVYLNQLGYQVKGVDLSVQSIAYAKQFENARLQFEVKDLRNLGFEQNFDIALNLFTSFGYFDSTEVNIEVLNGIHQSLKPKGKLLIDFFNAKKVIEQLLPHELKTFNGIDFQITKKVENQSIIKDISFSDKDQTHQYQEKVQALSYADFMTMLAASGFEIKQTWGDYQLNGFDENISQRLIILAEKKDA
jgi:SAM-dependent methyltransferase